MADAAQIATVAVILVSDRFLVSHAFLKDSAVRIRACALTAIGRDIRSSVDIALQQAGVRAGEIQLVEAQGPTPTADRNGLLRSINIEETSRPLKPLKDYGATGLAGLCGIGEFLGDECII